MMPTFSALLEKLNQFKNLILNTQRAYVELSELLPLELRSIETHDLRSMDTLVEKKAFLGETIEELILNLQKSLIDISSYSVRTRNFGEDRILESLKLSDAFLLFADLESEFQGNSNEKTKLQSLLEETSKNLKAFLDFSSHLKEPLQRNKYMLEQLYHSYQQSIQFWNEAFLEYSTSYDAKGQKQIHQQQPMIHVRA